MPLTFITVREMVMVKGRVEQGQTVLTTAGTAAKAAQALVIEHVGTALVRLHPSTATGR